MLGQKLSVLKDLADALQKTEIRNRATLPFLHDMNPDIISEWNLQDFDPAGPNDEPNMNIAVMVLILATNLEPSGNGIWKKH